VYNRKLTLRRALESLSSQTYKNFEVIVCDDGSTDDPCSVVNEFKSRLLIRFIRINNSGGPARPRNVAAFNATGEWISYLDSDDCWNPTRLEILSTHLESEVDLVYHPLRLIDSQGRIKRRGFSTSVGTAIIGDPLRFLCLFGNPIPTSGALIKRSALQNLGGMSEDPNLIAYEDFDLWLRFAAAGGEFRFINRVLGFYSISNDSISSISCSQVGRQEFLFNLHRCYFHSYLPQAQSRQNYVLGTMLGSISGEEANAIQLLLKARGLPSFTMKIGRILKILKICLIRRPRM
jgi:glycosyltransferase involved in cell wall biosynthesis